MCVHIIACDKIKYKIRNIDSFVFYTLVSIYSCVDTIL